MKKYTILIFAFCMGWQLTLAQSVINKALSAGAELNIGQRSAYNIGYGFSGKFELPVSSTLSVVLTGGYNQLRYRRSAFPGAVRPNNDIFVPLKGGIRYFVDPRFYTEGELGAVVGNTNSGNLFTYSVGTGFLLPIGRNSQQAVDIGLRYEDWSKSRFQQFAIRVAYRFGF